MFRIDPVAVLNSDTLEWLVRVAASTIIANDMKREKEQAKGKRR